MFSSRPPIIAALLLASLLAARLADAQTAWREGFETAAPTWRPSGGDAQFRILEHQRVQGDAHTGHGCEWLRLEADGGSRVYIAHDVGRPAVIDDLVVSVWLRSDRPGLQLAARIVLPRSADPRTGQAVTALVTGSGYTDVGRWQQLRLEGVPRLLAREVRLLRTQLGPQVDDREAYVDAVLLNVYGGPGATNVWIDDLELLGRVAQPAADGPALSPAGPDSATAWTSKGVTRLPPVGPGPAAAPKHTVRLSGSLLLVDGRPMFPRIIQHRGEPLGALKKLGFNAVWLPSPPPPEVLDEADRLGLWLVCPPPRLAEPNAAQPVAEERGLTPYPQAPPASSAFKGSVPVLPPPDIGPQFDCVLAWDLGGDLGPAELASTQRWAEQIRAADRRGSRPLVCRPRTELRGYSRSADLLLIDRRPLGTSLDLAGYAAWVRRQPLLASLGTPVWTTVQTQPNEALRQQVAALDPGAAPPLAVAPEQVRLLCYTAVAAGSRGILFASDSPLDATDADTRQRAMTLELLNLELDLMEPWTAGGGSAAPADCSVRDVRGTVLTTDRARLLLPLWSSPGAQCVPAQSAANALTLVVPGVPEASSAFELTFQGVNPLRHKRVAGGVSVTFDEFSLAGQVLLAQDPLIIAAVHHRAAQGGRRAAELSRHLAVQRLNAVERLAGQLSGRSRITQAPAWLAAARRSLQSCDAQLAAGDPAGAALNAQRAGGALRLVERAYWDAAQKGLASLVTSPAALMFDTLPSHWRLIDRLRSARFSQDLLVGGDFEDKGTMQQAGWQYIHQPAPGVQGAAELTPQAAHSGRLGLRLSASPLDPKNPPVAIETPPVLFTSPSVQVSAGQIVCIHGWVKVPGPITAGADGLLVVDSIAGEALADRIGQTKGWREFALYRVAPQSGPVCVTFALSGLGEAWLDDVGIEVLQ